MLALLGATIFYAHRLSASLNNFRETRREFDKVMTELSRNIDDAERSITSLKAATRDTGQGLQKTLNDARGTASDLEIIIRSGEKLAHRLETLADRNRRIAQGLEDPGEYTDDTAPAYSSQTAPAEEPEIPARDRAPAFLIRDRDVDDDSDPQSLQSQAERDLYNALQKNRKSGAV